MNSRIGYFVLLASLLFLPCAFANASSLINPDQYRGIASDHRAYRVGDPLTIVVLETASATSSAGTNADREWSIFSNLHRDDEVAHDIGVEVGGNADGAGRTTRQGQLRAQIGVRVISIENGALLRVRGEQAIEINGETQTIVIEGLVRSEDISPDNIVLSPRLSDATIEFTGDGVVSESQRQSWIYRLFSWLGLI